MHIAHRNYTLNDGPALPSHQFPPCTLEELQAYIAPTGTEAKHEDDDDPAPSAREERFDATYIDALLQLLNTVCHGLPAFVQRRLLRRASRVPGLHGHFAQRYGEVWFFDKDGSSYGPSESWITHANGLREKMW